MGKFRAVINMDPVDRQNKPLKSRLQKLLGLLKRQGVKPLVEPFTDDNGKQFAVVTVDTRGGK